MSEHQKKVSRRKVLTRAVSAGVLFTGGAAVFSAPAADEEPKDQNGVLVYPKGAKGKLPEGVKEGTPIVSRFGFKLGTIKDKDKKDIRIWIPGTEKDFRQAEAKRLGIKPEEVKILDSCHLIGPTGPCSGFCTSGFCTLAYYGPGHYYYCFCG